MTIYDHLWSVLARSIPEYLLSIVWPFMTTHVLYKYTLYLNTCWVWDDHLWPHIVCISIVNSSTRILTIIIASLKLFKENLCFKITLCFISLLKNFLIAIVTYKCTFLRNRVNLNFYLYESFLLNKKPNSYIQYTL